MIALIDYGAGNTSSVERALQRLGAASRRVTQPDGLANARAIILPGVGHYSAIIRALDASGLRTALLDSVSLGVPFLGICLGLQALYDSSAEALSLRGLGLLSGAIQSLPHGIKLPHMGWNRVRALRPSVLLEGISQAEYFYFAHTFAALNASHETVAVCEHGATFAAVVERGPLFATQFHPEKSGPAGARVLNNFLLFAKEVRSKRINA